MDIQPQAQQAISDDQELAKVLAGVGQQADQAAINTQIEEDAATVAAAAVVPEEPVLSFAPIAPMAPVVSLDSIKKDALTELRPLVDKLELSPEEKFDTYLLLLRSTDDSTLIAPAHEAARAIVDETRRAQALLDVIKEIDYLSGAQATAV